MNITLTKYRDFIYAFMLIFLISILSKQCHRTNELEGIINTYSDSLKTITRKDGTTVSTVSVYETNSNTFKKIPLKTPEEKRLQKEVDNNTVSATSVSTENTISALIPDKDTVSVKNIWTDLYILRMNDSFKIDLKLKNEFVVNITQTGFFKNKTKVEVISYNPSTKVKTVTSYLKKSSKYNISIGPAVGYGLSADLKPNFFIGVSIQYNLFRI